MSFEHAAQTEYQPVTQNEYENHLAEVAKYEATIAEIKENMEAPNFYQGDRVDVEKSLAFFEDRRDSVLQKLSTRTLGIVGINVAA